MHFYHPADSRGNADHGWLKSRHTFSFANYHHPERVHFGALRVLNDDIVAPGMGFGTHPHANMEIISIPLEGELEHRDSMKHVTRIVTNDIQVMSAGTGIYHSEYNASKEEQVKFLQIWVIPDRQNVTPRYDQITLNAEDSHNTLQQILSPNPNDAGVWIYQQAWFHLAQLDIGINQTYTLKKKGNGVYLFVLNGKVEVDGQIMDHRDGMGITESAQFSITAIENCKLLLMEVPMVI